MDEDIQRLLNAYKEVRAGSGPLVRGTALHPATPRCAQTGSLKFAEFRSVWLKLEFSMIHACIKGDDLPQERQQFFHELCAVTACASCACCCWH